MHFSFPITTTTPDRSCLRHILLLVVGLCITLPASAREVTDKPVANPAGVAAFYKERKDRVFWFSDSANALALRRQLLRLLDQCDMQGLDPQRYPTNDLRIHLRDTTAVMTVDRLFTDAAISYMKDVFTGAISSRLMGYDELSGKAADKDHAFVLHLLANCTDSASFDRAITSLEPSTKEYLLLKTTLYKMLQARQQDTVQRLKIVLNTYRWIHHFHYPKFVVVNITSGTLHYYQQDSLMLEMKVVTGTPATPTPRFAAYCNQVILYPYWNVPRSIAVNEFLPLCKKAPGVLAFMNIQMLDSKGNIVDPKKLTWKRYTKKNFPYRFRQSTGCDNALGVIKFNLTSPYGVYLHDTNAKFSFAAKKRYFSHGCIRLEKPMELANYLLPEHLDEKFLNACIKNEKPVVLDVPEPVPVFVVYLQAGTEMDDVVYYDDAYKLM